MPKLSPARLRLLKAMPIIRISDNWGYPKDRPDLGIEGDEIHRAMNDGMIERGDGKDQKPLWMLSELGHRVLAKAEETTA